MKYRHIETGLIYDTEDSRFQNADFVEFSISVGDEVRRFEENVKTLDNFEPVFNIFSEEDLDVLLWAFDIADETYTFLDKKLRDKIIQLIIKNKEEMLCI